MFVQVIECPVRDSDGMRAHFYAGVERLHPTAVGWLGATSGVTDDGVWINIICFASPEAARTNSARPEQGRWWDEGERYRTGAPRFVDSTDVTVLGSGPASDAGFVRVIEGGVRDRHSVEALLSPARGGDQPDRGLAIWHDDALTLARTFTSEARARSDPVRDALARFLTEMATYDIARPWTA